MKNKTLCLFFMFFFSATASLLAQGVWPDDIAPKGNRILYVYEADTIVRTALYNKDAGEIFMRESGNFPSTNAYFYDSHGTLVFLAFYDVITLHDNVSATLSLYLHTKKTDTLSHFFSYDCDLTDPIAINRLSSHTDRAQFLQDPALCDCLSDPENRDTTVEYIIMDEEGRPLLEWEMTDGDTIIKKVYTYLPNGATKTVKWNKNDMFCGDYDEYPSITVTTKDKDERQIVSVVECYDENGEVIYQGSDTSYYEKDNLVAIVRNRTDGQRRFEATYRPSGQTKTSRYVSMKEGELQSRSENMYFYRGRRAYRIVEIDEWEEGKPKRREFILKWKPTKIPAIPLPDCMPNE